MADRRLPLLRGRISAIDTYENPQGRSAEKVRLPSVDPKAHSQKLLQQLDAIRQNIHARPEGARDKLATREIVAIRPAPDTVLAPEQLDDARSDARLIGVVPDTGTVILDIANPGLDYLRRKMEAFADDTRAKVKSHPSGTSTVHRDGERAIAPIDTVGLAELVDIRGAHLRNATLTAENAYWFEIACRGGYRRPPAETSTSREQVARQIHHIGAGQKVDELVGPEQVYFFVRLTQTQLEALLSSSDCIYEVELAPPLLRDLKLLEDVTSRDLRSFSLEPPPQDAPAIVLLDSGIATGHPLLKAAILSAVAAGPEIPSPEDTYGHGTKMAGIALYRDIGAALQNGHAAASHWLQSSRLLVKPGQGTAADENYPLWPVLTHQAVLEAEQADSNARDRVFALAVTRTMQEPPLDQLVPTLWSCAVDQIAYFEGRGRLMMVSAGNARQSQWLTLAQQYPQLQLSEKIHQPAQSTNALTVGAYTMRTELPRDPDYDEARVVADRPGGVSPYTSTGLVGSDWPIKPDIVMEGGNLAVSGPLTDDSVPTLSALTTSHRHTQNRPLGLLSMTSEATARAAHLAARIWSLEPKLRPETVRALIVHSATWTPEMVRQFPGLTDRLLACGYGVPDEWLACECARDRATIIIEDEMPNAIIEEVPKQRPPKRPTTKATEPKERRRLKLYRLPIPEELLGDTDADVELRVTLSYFAEPNKFGRTVFHGLDLKWDMQGPRETEEQFLQRVNKLKRPEGPDGKRRKTSSEKSFPWDIKIQARSRGTVQSDRWRGKMSELSGDKLIAIVPVLGWWNQRRNLKTHSMRFSLVVSVFGPGVYAAIRPHIAVPIESTVEV